MVEKSQPITSKIEPQSQENASNLLLAQRRAFMCLSLEERRQILYKQAQEVCNHYQKNTEWQELETGNIVD